MTAPLLYYVHIPKAAGTSASNIFFRQYGQRLGLVDVAYLDSWQEAASRHPYFFDSLFGHFFYGFHRPIARPYEYTAVLREPVDALLSYAAYIARRPDHPFHALLRAGTAEELLALPAELQSFFRNYQSTMIAGDAGASLTETERIADTEYPIVGTTDMLHETALLWQKRYGWGSVLMPHENAAPADAPRRAIDASVRRRLEALVDRDLPLYAYAKERLAREIRGLSGRDAKRLAQFKATGVLPAD